MANSDNTGQDRVRRIERNNRKGATGMSAATPKLSGAKKGFRSNAISGGKQSLRVPKGRRV